MTANLDQLIDHDMSEECPVCRARDIVAMALLPAAAAWELNDGLPRFSVALDGAAELLGAMLLEGIPRDEIEAALARLIDEIEQRIVEDKAMGGPPQGNA